MATKLTLNEKLVKALEADGDRLEVEDAKQRNLFLRVTANGAKSWSVVKRVHGTRHRVTIGAYPQFTVQEAREKALGILRDIARGNDPAVAKVRRSVLSISVADALEAYIAKRGDKLRERTVTTYFDDIKALLGTRFEEPVSALTRDAIAECHATRSKDSPARADGGARALRAVIHDLRNIYTDADGVPLLADNPVAVLSRDRSWNRVAGRDDRLHKSQLAAWWGAVMAERDAVADYFATLLLTGMRRTEALVMRWEWINLNEGIVTLPSGVTKTRRTHVLPLGDWLAARLAARKSVCDVRESGPWVFPGHINGRALVNPEKPRGRIVRRSGVKFSPHTLRRTFASLAAEEGVQPFVIRRLLNHSSGSITEAYAHIALPELRAAMQRIEDAVLVAAGVKSLPASPKEEEPATETGEATK